jgi:lipopolysaccharide export system permease protein
MPIKKIWESYFIKQFLLVFLLLLLGFYGLYVLLDYSTHASSIHHNDANFKWIDIVSFYLYEFSNRLEVLLPIALLIATIKTLTSLNVHNELVALMASGIALKRLLRPFLFLGLLFTLLMYINNQVFLPKAKTKLSHIENVKKKDKREKMAERPQVQHVILKDDSTLLFQTYEATEERFFDAYWIRNIDDMYRIKFLYPSALIPWGQYVDHIKRNASGQLEVVASENSIVFPEMLFNKKRLIETTTLPEQLSYTKLWDKISNLSSCYSEKGCQILTTLYYKIAMPWLCLLAILAPAPFCVRFTRTLPIFMIYSIGTFAIIAFYITMEAALIVGGRQLVDPFYAVGVPFLAALGVVGWRYYRIGQQ